jgi:hypothetical protein
MAAEEKAPFHLGHGLVLDGNGAIVSWEGRIAAYSAGKSAGMVRYAGLELPLQEPVSVSRKSGGVTFVYHWSQEPNLAVSVTHSLVHTKRAWTWKRDVQVTDSDKLRSNLTIAVESGLDKLPSDTWLPLVNGLGRALGTNGIAFFRLAGAVSDKGEALALPMVSVPMGKRGRLVLAADPFFSVTFAGSKMSWTYLADPGLENGCENRSIYLTSHDGGIEESLRDFFQIVIPDIPPGPRWLHDIALIDYDYMSDGGQGWFRDIDALAAAIPQAEHHKVFLCLHGWYDFLGRYCFDDKTGKFDPSWTVFSNYEVAKTRRTRGKIGGDEVSVGFVNNKPIPMSLMEVHARLKYARARGFRVGIYYADGMDASDGLPDFDPATVLHYGGWSGSDTIGRSFVQNPLHPKVRQFYLDYARAMVEEFGPDIDMLNWDETFHIPCGELGTNAAPGYADRAVMRLAHDITKIVDDYNYAHHRQIAFMTSDCLGAVYGPKDKAPYALMAHGTYQDSWCQPGAWSYGIFPNYRNVMWSLCWWPMTKWPWIDFGVRNFQEPVSLSNGWGDDTGFSEMTEAQRARAISLFDWRKTQPTKLKWFEDLPLVPQR